MKKTFGELDTWTWFRLDPAVALGLGLNPETIFTKTSEPGDRGRAAPVTVRGSQVITDFAAPIDVDPHCEVTPLRLEVRDAP